MQRVSQGNSGSQHGAVAELLPGAAAEVAVPVGGGGDQHLRLSSSGSRVAYSSDQPAVVLEGVAVDRAAGVPIAGRPQDRDCSDRG